jgi:SAM-dependent methyltransferase
MSDPTAAILAAYGRPSPPRRLYLALRLRLGGYGALLPLLPTEGSVVDLGAGDGLLAQLLVRTRPGLRVTTIDHDPARVARTREAARGLPVEAVVASMEEATLPPSDAILLVDVLHYLDALAQERMLARAAAALRPGGVLLLRDPDRGAGWRFRATLVHERLFLTTGLTHGSFGRYRTGEAWARLVRRAGLDATVHPLPRRSPFADRVVTGRQP